MRLLTFEHGDHNRFYALCYASMLTRAAPLATAELRTHGSILTKLERIGVEANPNRSIDEVKLYKSIKGGPVVLEGDEYLILKRFTTAYGSSAEMHRSMTREMDGMLTWLDAAPGAETEAELLALL